MHSCTTLILMQAACKHAYDAPVTPVAPVITYNMAAGILAEVATDATPIVVTVTATTVHVS